MLIPVLQDAVGQARNIGCMSNLRQINLAFEGYFNENNFYFPQSSAQYSLYGTGFFEPYIEGFEIYQCPAVDNSGNLWCNYSYSGNLVKAINNNPDKCRTTQIKNGSILAMIWDGGLYSFYFRGKWLKGQIQSPAWSPPGLMRHFSGANFLFLDGHVKWYMYDQTEELGATGGF
jgi:prepilin-type processing-associated H-X9-DG protein